MKVILLMCFLCVSHASCSDETEIQKTFDLLEQGEKQIALTDEKEVILVFGPTGSGKSTFIQWIAGDNTKLISKEISPDSGDYLIEDMNDRIGSSTLSKTLFPEMITDEVTGTTFYDFPGFSDTRSSSHDIAASFFMKTVMDHVENVKMLFLTSYYTVQKGMDRAGFPGLIKNINDLIGDVEKFKDSIALVVSKVDNIYIKQGRKFILKPDSVVITGIANYLRSTSGDYQTDLNNPDISDKRRKYCANAIKIINILLTQEDGEYTRIILFRRPDEEGPLSEIVLLTEGKAIAQEIMSENLDFTHTGPNDFGFTISDTSKLEISNLVSVINDRITASVSETVEKIRVKLKRFIEPVREKVEDNILDALSMTEAFEFATQADKSQQVLTAAVEYFSLVNDVGDVGEKMASFLFELDIEIPESLVENISKLSKYFKFFQLFNEEPLPVSSLAWTKSYQSALSYLTQSKQSIKDNVSVLAEEINSEITSDVDLIADSVKANFSNDVNRMAEIVRSMANNSFSVEVNPLDAKTFHKKLLSGSEFLAKLVEKVKTLPSPQMLSEEISKTLISIDFELPNDVLTNISQKSKNFEVLQTVSSTNLSFSSALWSNSFKTIETYIQTQDILTLVRHTQETINFRVESLLRNLVEEVQFQFDKKSLELEIDVLGNELQRWFFFFTAIHDDLGANISLKKLLGNIASSLSELKVDDNSIREALGILVEEAQYLGFLKALKGDDTDSLPTAVTKKCISNLVEYLHNHVNFIAFVMELYEKLSRFEVQRDVTRYDVLDLSDWGQTGHPQGIHVDKNNFQTFMGKIKEFNLKSAAKITEALPSETQITILNSLLKITLKKQLIAQCPTAPNSTVVLRANFIKFSDFLDSNGHFKGCGWSSISTLEIYALNTLFIDQNLDALGERLQVSIIAPKWEVIGIRRISLNGRNGEPLARAENGHFPSGHGRNGSPGLPGGSAGAFFGVVNFFVNSENLTISANGGSGGSGQSGGNGANGQNGRTPPDMNELSGNCDVGAYTRNGFRYSDESAWTCGTGRCRNHKIFGHDGTSGGNAGSCGVGGQAGLSGQVSVISFKVNSKELKLATDGRRGDNGLSGVAGAGGQHGSNRGLSCRKPWLKGWGFRSTNLEGRGTAPNGVQSHTCNPNIPVNPLPARNNQKAGFYLRNFVNFCIENSNERFVRLSALETYNKINTNPEMTGLQDTLGLVEDLKMLESVSREKNLNLLPFYKVHLTNVVNYAANPNENEKSDEFKKVLTYLYTAGLTQILNLKKSRNNDLIIDLSGYLDIVEQNTKTLSTLRDESRMVTVVETLKNDYENDISKKIEEAKGLIVTAIVPEFENLGYQISDEVSAMVQELIFMQSQTKQEITILEAKKRNLEKSMRNKVLGEALMIFSTVCSFFGPVGATIGMIIDKSTSVASSLRINTTLDVPHLGPSEVVPKIEEIGTSLLDLSNSLKNDRKSIRKVIQGIKDMEQVLKELEIFERAIFERLVPLIEKMGKELLRTANELETKSSVSLDVVGWQVQETLRDTSLEIQQFTRGFKVHESMAKLVEKLEEAIKTLIKIYDRIQDYQEQQRLAVYMAQLSSASVRQVVVSNPLISNSFRDLQISIRSNIILNQYNSALNAFKQWIFPFAEVFSEDFKLPEHLVSINIDIEALASTASARIEDIRSRLQKYKTTIEDFDKHIYLAQFNGSSETMRPFYVWKNEENRELITRLLAGETVFVNCDISNSATGKDAIKFNFVEFSLKSNDSSVKTDVNRNLLNFGISMTHLGNSNYRYNGQYFSIASSSQSMHHSFEKSSDGKAMYGNNVYYKLLSGDIMLSPYAMWELKLTLDQYKSTKSFGSLSKFWDKVDLVLEGSGSFVSSGGTNFDVESYYKLDDSIKLTKT